MATYYDQFYHMDPGNPPAAGTALSPETLSLTDGNNDNYISTTWRDRVDGQRVDDVWRGDTITLADANGNEFTITGDTFYLRNGDRVFTPSDGSILHNATFVSSTYVTTQNKVPVGDLGPECFGRWESDRHTEWCGPNEWVPAGDEGLTRDYRAQRSYGPVTGTYGLGNTPMR